MKTKFFTLFVSTGVVMCLLASAVRAEVHFKDLSFAEAKKLAAKEHKKVMIDFYTTWCGWCKVLDKQTYTDEAVGKIADAKFISLKIDAEKGEGKDLARQYKVTGYPTIVFFSPDGKEIDRVVGYEDASKFARSLKNAAAGGTAGILQEVEGKKPCTDPAKWIVAANQYAEKHENEKARKAFERVMQLDPDNKKNLREEGAYGVAFLTTGEQQWPLLEQALMQYPMSGEGQQAVTMLIKHQLDMGMSDEAGRTMDRWAMQHPKDAQTFNFFAWNTAEKGVLLDRAEDYANRAFALATDPQDRASVMDTRAEVIFKSNRPAEAAQIEQEALNLLDPSHDTKLIAELNKQKTKFEAAQSTGTADGIVPVEVGSASNGTAKLETPQSGNVNTPSSPIH